MNLTLNKNEATTDQCCWVSRRLDLRWIATMVSATANWDACGDTFYRKIKLYDAIFDEDLELENYLIVGAPFSGAIGMATRFWFPVNTDFDKALFRDEEKLHSYRGTQATKSSIDIYTCAGKLIQQIKVRITGSASSAHWLTGLVGQRLNKRPGLVGRREAVGHHQRRNCAMLH